VQSSMNLLCVEQESLSILLPIVGQVRGWWVLETAHFDRDLHIGSIEIVPVLHPTRNAVPLSSVRDAVREGFLQDSSPENSVPNRRTGFVTRATKVHLSVSETVAGSESLEEGIIGRRAVDITLAFFIVIERIVCH